jgi:hypothetical protein
MQGVVTLSASYGARGDAVGRALAERLQLPFVDRVIPTSAAAHNLGLPEDVGESLDEPTLSRWERIAARFVWATAPAMPEPLTEDVPLTLTPEAFRAAAKAELQRAVGTTGAVVLGRAGMAALGHRPDVLCVRLDGPVEARIAQVVALGIDPAAARQGQREVDRAREAYARVFFSARQDDPRLYHLILDSTVLSAAACVEIIARAAQDRFGTVTRNGGSAA